jgi:hypothetical protein
VGLITELGAGSVAVDTAIFIYFIEENPRFLPEIEPLFKEADQGKRELITSALTLLLEVLVVPYRAGNRLLAERYEALLAVPLPPAGAQTARRTSSSAMSGSVVRRAA